MSEPDFIRAQREFAAHLRDPERHAAPADVEDRRLAVYRELFFNNIDSFLSNGFPVLHSLLPAQRWQRLVRDFFRDHASSSPYFVEIPQEFVSWLAESFTPEEGDPPFMLELAHYEWMELVLDVSREEIPATGFNPGGDLLQGSPMISPLSCVLSYHYPVHLIGESFQPREPLEQPVWLLVYRDRADRVQFMEINAVTARLLELLRADEMQTGEAALERIAGELSGADREQVLRFGADTLRRLRERDIVLGTRLDPV